MQEDTENKMFQDLLSDYAAPAPDNGFSEFVLTALPRPKNQKRLKSLLVGGAGALGAAIAATQIKTLLSFVSEVKVPTLPVIETPSVNVSALANSSLMGSAYAPMLIGCGVILVLWMAQALMFGDGA